MEQKHQTEQTQDTPATSDKRDTRRTPSFHRRRTLRITEKTRTAILLVLLLVAIGFIIWSKSQYSSNFINSF